MKRSSRGGLIEPVLSANDRNRYEMATDDSQRAQSAPSVYIGSDARNRNHSCERCWRSRSVARLSASPRARRSDVTSTSTAPTPIAANPQIQNSDDITMSATTIRFLTNDHPMAAMPPVGISGAEGEISIRSAP